MSSLDNTIFGENKQLIDPSIKIVVYKESTRKLIIVWSEIPAEYFGNGEEEAYLEVSDSPVSEFIPVATLHLFSPPYFLDDHSMATYYRSPMVYYRLRFPAVDKCSRVVSNEHEPNLYGMEISRRHAIMLREGHAGNLMYLFIRRRLKERCPKCYDTLRGTRSMSNCPVCLGTGYLNGYYDPIGIYVSLSGEHTTVNQSLDDTEIPGNIQGWTTGFPRISLGDVLVDASTREIWHVAQIGLSTHKRVVTKQDLVLQSQEDDLSIYKLLDRIPFKPKKEDSRHGEIVF